MPPISSSIAGSYDGCRSLEPGNLPLRIRRELERRVPWDAMIAWDFLIYWVSYGIIGWCLFIFLTSARAVDCWFDCWFVWAKRPWRRHYIKTKMVAPMLRHWKITGTRIDWFCVPFYPITSRAILWHPIISHHIPSYPIISHHIPSYPIISHHIPSYPISYSLPISHSRSIECFVRGHRQFPIRKQLLQPWRVRELSEAPLRRLLILYNFIYV